MHYCFFQRIQQKRQPSDEYHEIDIRLPAAFQNHAPRLTVEAKVVAKRTNITHFNDGTDTTMVHTNTTYYVTFEVESGDRMEMNVRGSEYGMLAEGDVGKLTFQGTRYLNFERC